VGRLGIEPSWLTKERLVYGQLRIHTGLEPHIVMCSLMA